MRFWVEKRTTSNGFQNVGFGSKAQAKNAKRGQIKRSTKWLSRIVKNLAYVPNKSKFRFQKTNSLKIIFEDIQIPEYMVFNYKATTSVQHFKPISFCAMTQKPGEDDDVTFETYFFAFLIVVHQQK